MEIGQKCWTESGYKAIYAGEIEGQKYVRMIMRTSDCYGDVEEYPENHLVPVTSLLDKEPKNVFSDAIAAECDKLEDLKHQRKVLLKNIQELKNEEAQLEEVKAKYPDISVALDFLKGNITHVVEVSYYKAPRIVELNKFLEDRHKYRGGLKLISLFGCDRKGNTKWKCNQYRDGSSGQWIEFIPFRTLEGAKQHIVGCFNDAVRQWRSGDLQLRFVTMYEGIIPDITLPEDVMAEQSAQKEKQRMAKISKLHKELAKLNKPEQAETVVQNEDEDEDEQS